MSQYTDDELRELYNWLTTQHRLVEDELAWRSRCEDLDHDKSGDSDNGDYEMILTYELVDNPGYEYEDEVQTQFDACVRLQSIEPFCVWWQLTDGSGELVMSS